MTTEHNEEYELQITSASKKDLDKIPNGIYRRIDNKISQLIHNPRPRGVKQLKDDIYRIRVGDHRVIYIIDDINRRIIISRVKKRAENTYRAI